MSALECRRRIVNVPYMKALLILLLAVPLIQTGCESGVNDGSDEEVAQQSNRTTESTDATYTSTQTSVDGTSPATSGPPWEGDTKTENYSVADTAGNVTGSGVRTYTYTSGAWVLTSDVAN